MIFKKGDKVYDHLYGWGEVNEASIRDNFLSVEFENGVERFYSIDGCTLDAKPTLSFTEYTLEGFSQERPEELPEKWQLVYVRDGDYDDDAWHMRYFSHKAGDYYWCYTDQRQDGATALWGELSIKNPLE